MADFRKRGEDKLGQTMHRSQSRRDRAGKRRRRTVGFLERLEERTLLSFTPIAQPGDTLPTGPVYTAGTTNLESHFPANGDTTTTLTDGTETITFSQTMTTDTTPSNWGSPPATETNTPAVLFNDTTDTVTMTLSKPANVFGFEAQPDNFVTANLTATFFEGATSVGTIPITGVIVPGAPVGPAADGAVLFAAATNQAFTSVVITNTSGGGNGIVIAQPRYALASATLGITKAASLAEVQPLHNVTYTIGLTNSGPNDAIGTTVIDPLPAGTNFQGDTAPAGWTVSAPAVGTGGTVTFTDTNPFTDGSTATFTITAQVNSGVPAGTTISNTATGASLDSNSPAASASFTVGGPLTGTSGNEITGVEGSSTGTVQLGTFVDANQAATAADFTTPPGSTVVNWGDGSAPQTLAAGNLTAIGTPNGVTWTINAAHTYTEEGTYQYTVTVTSVDGAATTVDGSAIIADAPLTAGTPVVLTPNTGVAAPIAAFPGAFLPADTVVATFTDANTFATTADFRTNIDWGDGSPTSTGTVVATATPGLFDVIGGPSTTQPLHLYARAGDFTTKVTVVDDGGSQVVVPGTAVVTDLAVVQINPPLPAPSSTFTAVEGLRTPLFVMATFEDPNTLATVGNVNATLGVGSTPGGWGDGTLITSGVNDQLKIEQIGIDPTNLDPIFEVLGTHTYAEATPAGSPLTTTVIVTTLGAATGATTTFHGNVTVLDAGLMGSEGGEITGVEGASTGPVLLGSFVDSNQAATVADFTSGGGSVVVNWGDGSAPQTLPASDITSIGTPDGVTWNVTAAHTYAEEKTYAYNVTITDDDGAATTITGSAIIADAALTAVGTSTLAENTGVPFTAVIGTFTDANPTAPISDFTATIDWGDGSPNSIGIITQPGGVGTTFDVTGTHTYAKSGTYDPIIVVKDVGGSEVTLTTTLGSEVVTVTDLPLVPIGNGEVNNFTAQEDKNTGPIVLATFVDPNTLATVADVTAFLPVGGWGDTTPAVQTTLKVEEIGVTPLTSPTDPGDPIFEVIGSHTYAEEGTYTVNVTLETLGGVTTVLTPGTATVLDAPLTGSEGGEITGIEGNPTPPTVLLGSFVDANQAATVADFTAGTGSVVVNWGDGSTPETLPASDIVPIGTPNGVTWNVSASHTYLEEGVYAYSVTVTDTGGSATTITGSAIIADAPLSPTPTQPTVTQDEPNTFTLPVFAPPLIFGAPIATFTDANPQPPAGSSTIADFTATIDWGDGTPESAGTVSYDPVAGNYVVSGSHTYAVAGPTGIYPIQVFVVDTGGSKLTIDNTATVTANTLSVAGSMSPDSNSGLSNSVATPADTNVNQPTFTGTVTATDPLTGATSAEGFAEVTVTATSVTTGAVFTLGTVQADSSGVWTIKSTIALADDEYTITATATDQFLETTSPPGDITTDPAGDNLLLIDTTGPIITGMFFNHLNGEVDYIIQDPTPASGGPVSGVSVASLYDSSNYLLTKVHANKAFPGKWIVTNIDVTPDATLPNAFDVAVTFNSGKPIKGGFYLFTIRDSSNGNSSVQDLAENHLDGVFYGSFPSGNGINGSDFVAELDAVHNKVFAPQTIVGTASNSNGGVGGPPVGAVHSGHFTPAVPSGGGSVFGNDPKHLKGTPVKQASTRKPVVKIKQLVKAKPAVKIASHPLANAKVHDEAVKALVSEKTGRRSK